MNMRDIGFDTYISHSSIMSFSFINSISTIHPFILTTRGDSYLILTSTSLQFKQRNAAIYILFFSLEGFPPNIFVFTFYFLQKTHNGGYYIYHTEKITRKPFICHLN